MTQEFGFAFDPRFARLLRVVGVRPATARVQVGQEALRVCFGPWSLCTPLANITHAEHSGPYRWYTAIGPRLSLTDRGVTFGTTPSAGVCITFDEPVPALLPAKLLRHPGLTVTVADPAGLLAALATARRFVPPTRTGTP